jgi:hypothetical protein
MSRYTAFALGAAVCLLVLVLSPVVVLAGEPAGRSLRRHALARGRHNGRLALGASPRRNPAAFLLFTFTANPVFIALTAPARWVGDHVLRPLRRHARPLRFNRSGPDGHEGLWPDNPPFLSGVREPRRPKPKPPTDAMALREPSNPDEHTPRSTR